MADEKTTKEKEDLLIKGIDTIRTKVEQLEAKGIDVTKNSEFLSFQEKLTKDNEETKASIEKNAKDLINIDSLIKKSNLGSSKAENTMKDNVALYEKGLKYQGLMVMGKADDAKKFIYTEAESKSLMEHKTYRSDIADALGYWTGVPEFINSMIDQAMIEISPVTDYATHLKSNATSVDMTTITAHGVASWGSEVGTITEDTTLKGGKESLTLNISNSLYKASIQLLADTGFNLVELMLKDYSAAFGLLWGTGYISGSGIKQPQGILNGGSSSVNSGHATLFTADGLIALGYGLKTHYKRNAKYMARNSSMLALSILKDGNGQYLLRDIRSGGNILLNGQPIIEAPDVPAVAASAKALIYGDFSNYTILDSPKLDNFIVDPYTSKGSGVVEYLIHKGTDGMVTNPEGFVFQNIGA